MLRIRIRKNGFSLIEVLLGLVILAVGLLAVAGMQVVSIRGNSISHRLTEATSLIQNRMDELKRWPFDDAGLSAGHHAEGMLSGSNFSRSYDVEEISSTLKAITVNVQWTDKTNHQISSSTMKAR